MNAIFITQLLDPEDPVLGSVPSLVEALAARSGSTTVIANEVRPPYAAPDGVRVVSLGKERGAGRVARGAALERAVAAATRRRPAFLLAHMCPSYLALAGPIARARDVPALLWFAHPSVTAWLRAADRVATAILTSLPGAYPLPGPKVRAVGQAIDVDRFAWTPPARSDGYRILALGRTSPSKGFSTIIRAVGLARRDGLDARLRIAGPSTTPEERAHRAVLERELAVHLGHAGSIEGGLPPSDVPRAIADADALVNAMVPGSGDKVVFEAAAMGRPVLASNPAFASLLGDLPLNLRFPPGDARRLADLIADVAGAGDRDVGQLTRTLRSRVERDHSLAHWASEVMRAGEETERILEGRGTGRGTRDRHTR